VADVIVANYESCYEIVYASLPLARACPARRVTTFNVTNKFPFASRGMFLLITAFVVSGYLCREDRFSPSFSLAFCLQRSALACFCLMVLPSYSSLLSPCYYLSTSRHPRARAPPPLSLSLSLAVYLNLLYSLLMPAQYFCRDASSDNATS
jgi:hypothetical protein